MNSPHVSFRSCSFYIIVCYLFIIYNHSFICLLDFVEAQLQANITQTTVTMSQGRGNLAATSSGELVFFGGGNNATGPSDRVDIYNVTSGRWTTATLSVPRYDLAAASAGNLVFFAGGFNLPNISFDRVDIYNVSHGSWSTATLSQARYALAATSVGDSVLFGGGYNFKEFSVVVDIYNVTTNTWTTATLSTGRYYLTATSAANRYAFFAGGSNGYYISTVDICDTWRGTWKVSSLSLPRTNVVAASVDTLVFFAGGRTTISQMSNIVDIFNVTSDTWSIATLSEARAYFTATSFEEIVAFGGGFTGQGLSSVVDIYNGTSGLWSTLHLSQSRYVLASSSARNKIFFAGGSNVTLYLSVVDILCLDRNCPPPPLPSTPSTSVSPSNTDTFFSAVATGVVVGAIGLFFGIIVVLYIVNVFRQKRKEKSKTHSSENRSGAPLLTDAQDTSTPLLFNSSTESRALARHFQIPFHELVVGHELGTGSFGKVYFGRWNRAPVALKFCRERDSVDNFLSEIKVMVDLPPHPNIVQMYGVSLDGPQAVIVLEYCAGGNVLHTHTRLFCSQNFRIAC
jgi:hypothetical protein